MPESLRPLSFGQLIDAAARLVRAYPAVLIGLALLPLAGLVPLIPFETMLTGATGGMPDLQALSGLLPGLVVGGLVLVLVIGVLWPIGIAGLTHAAAVARSGQQPTFGAAWQVGWSLLWPIGWALTLIALLLVGAGLTMVLLVAGLWTLSGAAAVLLGCGGAVVVVALTTRLALILPVVVLERRVGVDALRRSAALMRGQVLRALALFFVVNAAVAVAGGLLAAGFYALPVLGGMAGSLLQLLVQGIGGALTGVVTLLLYLDVRCRTEALDLEQVAQLVAPAGPAAG